MKYHYYVVYLWQRDSGAGFAGDYIERNKKLDTSTGMNEVCYHIKQKYGYNNIIILNVIPLKD